MELTDIWLSSQNVPCNSPRSTYCIPQQRTSFHRTLDRHSLDPIQPQTRCSPLYHLSHLYVFPCSPGLTACLGQPLSERKQNDKTISKIYFPSSSQSLSSSSSPSSSPSIVHYKKIKIQSVNTQIFVVANLKLLHVSVVPISQHQAICFREVKRKLCSCSCISKFKNRWPSCRPSMKCSSTWRVRALHVSAVCTSDKYCEDGVSRLLQILYSLVNYSATGLRID